MPSYSGFGDWRSPESFRSKGWQERAVSHSSLAKIFVPLLVTTKGSKDGKRECKIIKDKAAVRASKPLVMHGGIMLSYLVQRALYLVL